MTLMEIVLGPLDFQARKHELGESYAEREINKMTNMELLQAISDALEEKEAQAIPEEPKNFSFTGNE